jgi:hypothetical protein
MAAGRNFLQCERDAGCRGAVVEQRDGTVQGGRQKAAAKAAEAAAEGARSRALNLLAEDVIAARRAMDDAEAR